MVWRGITPLMRMALNDLNELLPTLSQSFEAGEKICRSVKVSGPMNMANLTRQATEAQT